VVVKVVKRARKKPREGISKADETLARTIVTDHIADRFPDVTITDLLSDGDGGCAVYVTLYVTDLDLEQARRDKKARP
jgi:hypothetical protein